MVPPQTCWSTPRRSFSREKVLPRCPLSGLWKKEEEEEEKSRKRRKCRGKKEEEKEEEA